MTKRIARFLVAFMALSVMLPAWVCAAEEARKGGVGYPILTEAKLDHLLKTQGKGKVVILSFFASWCPPCRKEIPQLAHLRSKVPASDMFILGVSADEDLGALAKFLGRVKANFPIYMGADDLFIKHEVSAIPKMVIYKPDGEVFQIIEGLLPEASFNSMIDYLLGDAL